MPLALRLLRKVGEQVSEAREAALTTTYKQQLAELRTENPKVAETVSLLSQC